MFFLLVEIAPLYYCGPFGFHAFLFLTAEAEQSRFKDVVHEIVHWFAFLQPATCQERETFPVSIKKLKPKEKGMLVGIHRNSNFGQSESFYSIY